MRDPQKYLDMETMTTIVPGVISRRLNSVAVTANVGNVYDLYVRGVGTAANVLVTDAQSKVVSSNVSWTTLSYLNGVTAPIQTQLDSKAGVSDVAALLSGNLSSNSVLVGNTLILAGAGWTRDSVLVLNASGNVVTTNVSTTELQYLDGLTAPLVTTLAGKANVLTGAVTTIDYEDLAFDKALVSTALGKVGVSTTTATELGYLAGVTSSVQTQLNSMANTSGPVTFSSSVTIGGNLTVLGNVTSINTEQLVVEDPLLVLNSDRVSGTSGLYLQQAGGANVAVVYQGGNVSLFNTPSAANSTSLTVGTYAGLAAGPTSLQGSLTIVPPPSSNGYMSSMSTTFTTQGTTHTVPASIIDAANGGTGIFAGQLMIWVTNNATNATNKTGYATVSLLKTPPDFDVVPISVHRNVNLSQFDIGKSTAGTDIIILTDSDCSVSWKFDGSTIR